MAPPPLAAAFSVELPNPADTAILTTKSELFALDLFRFWLDLHSNTEHLGAYLHRADETDTASANEAQQPSSGAVDVAFVLCIHDGRRDILRHHVRRRMFLPGQSWGSKRLCTWEAVRFAQAQGRIVAVTVYVTVAAPSSTPSAAALCESASIRSWHQPGLAYAADWESGVDAFSDCTVRTAGGRAAESAGSQERSSEGVFRCHRVVLAAASPVFEAAFSNSMKETAQQELVVHETVPAVLRLLLLDAYGQQQLTVPVPLLLPLMKLADQYAMTGLHDAVEAWLMVAKLSATALAVLVPQATVLGLVKSALILATELAYILDECSDSASLLAEWRLEDMELLLEAADGSFAAFKAAVCWVLQQAAAAQLAPPAADAGSSMQLEAANGAQACDMPESAPAAAKAGTGSQHQDATGASTSQEQHVTAAAAQPAAAFDSELAWAILLPLVRFKGGFTPEQLIAARSLPGADSIPGLHGCLVEAWEELHINMQQGD